MKACAHFLLDSAFGRLLGLSFLMIHLSLSPVSAQTVVTDSIVMALDSMYNAMEPLTPIEDDTLAAVQGIELPDGVVKKAPRDWTSWRPDPQRALWLALVIPGGGQIYNRKYWKLPIVYGGFVGCIYAMTWNDMMYKDYSQAYLDICDTDPSTESYNKFLHLGAKIDSTNEAQYREIFKNRKNKYRRWRDLSFFVLVGVYALSVVDAYVDAELSQFDISKDLSLRVSPTVINNHSSANPFSSSSLGVNCSINF